MNVRNQDRFCPCFYVSYFVKKGFFNSIFFYRVFHECKLNLSIIMSVSSRIYEIQHVMGTSIVSDSNLPVSFP